MKGPLEDPEYWQTYGVVIGNSTLYNLRVAAWQCGGWLVDVDGKMYPPQ